MGKKTGGQGGQTGETGSLSLCLYLFDFGDITDEGSIIHKVVELLQLAKVLHIILPDDLKEAFRVTVKQTHIYPGSILACRMQKTTAGEYIVRDSGVFTATSPGRGTVYLQQLRQTSAMSSASPGLQSSSQRLGVMPLVLFWNFFGSSSLKLRNLSGKNNFGGFDCLSQRMGKNAAVVLHSADTKDS